MKTNPEKMLKKHPALIQSDGFKVVSHVQRNQDGWVLNTLMLENIDCPFKFKRQKLIKSLKGQRVNLTYYPSTDNVAGFTLEFMKVVRIKIS